jgi:hypothetical protein
MQGELYNFEWGIYKQLCNYIVGKYQQLENTKAKLSDISQHESNKVNHVINMRVSNN